MRPVRVKALDDAFQSLDPEFLMTALDTMPVEFTLIDAEDHVRFWNKHGVRVFKRGPAIIGRDVRLCHPQKSISAVEHVLQSLKSGEKDHVDFWIDKYVDDELRKLLIRYSAIRDDEGNYLGTVEITLNITPFQKLTGEHRISDLD